ncbi:histidine phosphatase family protein [Georgenia ruanii]|uniref:Histidine phosphatase family protein n=1 Tax=Georgenia ruanii TaxID=348442 RepID=A0A7J9UTP1_9MICO|nr:histidine phosphatase family protein [Georgenia ruanii]MPV87987.1 histidine phosphatase family protein [Georgenia ruanii]
MAELIVVRHGETEWSKSGRHTGVSDIPLTAEGEDQTRRLLADLGNRSWAVVLVSPRQRARRTAELAGIAEYEVLEDLAEWDYGVLEGHTTAEYEARRTSVGLPRWQLFADGAPGGEDAAAVGVRVDRVLERARREMEGGDVLLIAHSHVLRVLAARWLELDPRHGSGFLLGAARRGVLTYEHSLPVIGHWNVPLSA